MLRKTFCGLQRELTPLCLVAIKLIINTVFLIKKIKEYENIQNI